MVQGRLSPRASGRTPLALTFLRRCEAAAASPIYRALDAAGVVQDTLSGERLAREVRSLARFIEAASAPADRVLLVLPPGLDFVRAFWACILAGRVAVPVPSLDVARLRNAAPRLRAIVEDAGARLVVVAAGMEVRWTSLVGGDAASVLPLDAALLDGPALPVPEAGDTCDTATAYLQYTSGSTRTPRGVVIDARNVLAQCEAIAAVGRMGEGARILNWLPHHHDYGLVQGVLLPICTPAVGHLMSPMDFLRRPLGWLEAVDRHRITHTGAPNFAYAACLRALEATPGWRADLSCLLASSCGAEPLHAPTLSAFAEAFATHGWPAGALAPAYGMAEAVLAVTAMPLGIGLVVADAGPPGGSVACGPPLPGFRLRIVDPATGIERAAGDEGEIWVAGDSVARGYWGDPSASAATFAAFDASGDGPFLRTGDLGRWIDGALHVTGRLKDLIILRGRNLHPQDVEWSAQAADAALRTGAGAAFSVEGADGEAVVLVQEVERGVADLPGLAAVIRRAVAADHDLPLAAVVLLRPGGLPRTSSGKVQRSACREAYRDGRLAARHVDAGTPSAEAAGGIPHPGRESELAALWREVLGIERIGRRDGFIALGGDSLRATQLASRIRERFGIGVGAEWVLAQHDLAGMAAGLVVAEGEAAPEPRPEAPMARRPDRDGAPASSSQRRMWLVQQLAPGTTAYHMAFAFRIRGALDADRLAAAVDAVAARHLAFRTSLSLVGEALVQRVAPRGRTPLAVDDLSQAEAFVRESAARAWLEERLRRPFDLARPPLHHAHLARLAPDDHVFLWSIHHAIGDLWSFGILLRELSAAYLDLPAFRCLPEPAIDYPDFAAWQRSPAEEARVVPQVERWCQRLQGLVPLALPVNRQRSGPPSGRGGRVTARLDAGLRLRLKAFCAARGVTPFMVLLAAFQVLLHRCSGQHDLAVATPIANRHRLELEGLVGTLVNTVVMRADLTGDPGFEVFLQQVRSTALAAYADQDAPFEALVERLVPDRSIAALPLANVMFNLVGVPVEALSLGGLPIEAFDFDHGGAQFDLALSIDLDHFGRATLDFAEELFERHRAEALMAGYLWVLEQALATPDLAVGAFDIAAAGLAEGMASPVPAPAAEPASAPGAKPSAQVADGSDDVEALAPRLLALARELLPDAELEDSFFDAGGHSLLALRFAARVEDAFGVRPSMLALSQSSLIGVAAELAAARRKRPPPA